MLFDGSLSAPRSDGTSQRFDAIIKQAGGVNKFLEMQVASSDPAKQFVVRMNRDTFYSTSVFDMTGGIYIAIPETDQYVSIQVVDENHETQPMIYGPGRHRLTAKTTHAFVVVRSLDDNARRNLVSEVNSAKPFGLKTGMMNRLNRLLRLEIIFSRRVMINPRPTVTRKVGKLPS